MKPGPATSTADHVGILARARPRSSRPARADLPASFASTIAAFVARSPWEASRGGSTTTFASVEPGGQRALASETVDDRSKTALEIVENVH